MSQTPHALIEPILRATEEYGERERERLGRLSKAAAAVRLHHHNRHPWAQPGDEPHRVWILRFSDQDVGEMVWTGEDAEADAGGIGIIHKANGEIEGVPVRLEGAGHHLCNRCVNGLKGMLFLPTQGEEHGR